MKQPHPLTLADIERNGIDSHVGRVVRYRCGCDFLTSSASWVLCRYHEGVNDIVEQRKKFVRAAAKRIRQVIDDLPIPDEEKQSVKSDLAAEGRKGKAVINALSSVDHDYCDSCGQLTVVTDVWIDRCPMTLCQPCILDAGGSR